MRCKLFYYFYRLLFLIFYDFYLEPETLVLPALGKRPLVVLVARPAVAEETDVLAAKSAPARM